MWYLPLDPPTEAQMLVGRSNTDHLDGQAWHFLVHFLMTTPPHPLTTAEQAEAWNTIP
jgi:hypothetical protein